ncbi:hypothetical protein G7054_g6909 [Neopestalotiopsis clavispora]|nr:hypothetical protein G7054_g6909 [Neopestalotiopsis clavispora]
MSNYMDQHGDPSEQPRRPRRYVTDHNAEGKSVFSSVLDEELTPTAAHGLNIYDAFIALQQQPAQMASMTDLEAAQVPLSPTQGIARPDATVVRLVDFLPGQPALMHRTVTMDYGVLISGELELILDSGEARQLQPGDVVVQRGTSHAWRNPHPTNTARGLFVMSPVVPLVVNGEQLGEHVEIPERND